MEPSTAVGGLVPLTLERAKELAAEAVAERGSDYVYTTPSGVKADGTGLISCRYVHDNEPGCLVGYVLHKHGVSLADLVKMEGASALAVVQGPGRGDQPAAAWLDAAQYAQDKGETWAEAIAYANDLAVRA